MRIESPELRAFLLAGTRTAKLATVRADGQPHVVPIWFLLDGETVVFTTGSTSVKARNIKRDHRVSLCVDDEQPPFSFAVIEGTAQLIETNREELKQWATRIAGRYMGEDRAEAYGLRNSVEGEILVRIIPTNIIFQRDIAS
jgi:PPOX class probable F420-dependent enzyme